MNKNEHFWENLFENVLHILQQIIAFTASFLNRFLSLFFGSGNERIIRAYTPKVTAINERESAMQALSDTELKECTHRFRQRLDAGETLDDLLVDAFAAARESGRRNLKMRHYDVQLTGGMILHSGTIAEMVTGEGKTLVATLAAYLNALAGKGVHVITVNDYLARRDSEWMGPLFIGLGLEVGAIQSSVDSDGRQGVRRKHYQCDITYGTNNEFGFDFLRDNMKPLKSMQVQRELNYAIIDEVDNILIDEARTPLIISGPAFDDTSKYYKADRVARQLKREQHFEMKEKEHTCHMTDEGVRYAEELAGVESFYTAGNMEWPHMIDNSLKAHHLYKLDVNYVVQQGEVVIVDEFTGRLMPGRHWSDGLHQAVEAKEGVRIKEESQTLATVTLQNYFKLYAKLSGMTGTAMSEAGEFLKIYNLNVVSVPTHRPLQRQILPDVIYKTEKAKYDAICKEIEEMHKWDRLTLKKKNDKTKEVGEPLFGTVVREQDAAFEFIPQNSKKRMTIDHTSIERIERRERPILVGTVSIEKSERLSRMLTRRGVKHEVLNAKFHEREAEIVAQAGRKGAVTIATNMAGRGTDIILGGNPEFIAWDELQNKYESRLDVPKEEWDSRVAEISKQENMEEEGKDVQERGGLHIIGTERHEARRIDLQLRGRAGRQGDQGSARFFLSMEDDLMRIFAGEWVKKMLNRLGMADDEAIESRMVSNRIQTAQKKVEERNFEARKSLLEYDEVMDEQRKRVYQYRQTILDGANCKPFVVEMIENQIQVHLNGQDAESARRGLTGEIGFLDPHYGTHTFSAWIGQLMGVEIESNELRGMGFEQAEEHVRSQAVQDAQNQIEDQIEENLPDDPEIDQREWNWAAVAKWANVRWSISTTDRGLKKVGREQLAEWLGEQADAAIRKVDLSEGKGYLEDDWGKKTTCSWVKHKFGQELLVTELDGLDNDEIVDRVRQIANTSYSRREREFPVAVAMERFFPEQNQGQRYDRDALIAWANQRFDAKLTPDRLRNQPRESIRNVLLELSDQFYRNDEMRQMLEEQFHQVFGESESGEVESLTISDATQKSVTELVTWAQRELKMEVSTEEALTWDRTEVRKRLEIALDARYRPEMCEMERVLLLQVLDGAWKDHLYGMDHLRQGIGLRGYAQIDPKVEYKREGMKEFARMWTRVADQVTGLVFRMEQADSGFVGSLWTISEAVHEEATAPTQAMNEQTEAAMKPADGQPKVETIRNRGERVGRNDPCPCGSGKKYKRCCLRQAG